MDEDDYIIDEPEAPEPYEPEQVDHMPFDAEPTKPRGAASKGGKKPPNKRLGRIKKSDPDEPAEFEEGSAHGSRNFDPGESCAQANLWWENDGGDNFIISSKVEGEDLWSRWPMTSIKKLLRELPIYPSEFKGEKERLHEMDRVLLHARKHRCVHRMVDALAGYKSGIHGEKSRRFIVASSPQIVEPKDVPWDTMREFIEGRLRPTSPGWDGNIVNGWQDQSVMFHAWCKSSYLSLTEGEPGSYMGGHVLVLAGAGDSGKSRLQTNIIKPLLGGRAADPTTYLTGMDAFNADMIEAECLLMEELTSGSHKTQDRVQLSEQFKKLVATEAKRVRLMKTDPFTVEPFWRVSLSINNDPDKMRAFPMLTPDFRDKVLMLLVDQVPLPMPTDTPDQRKAWNAKMREELPGYIYWLLNHFEIPEELLKDETGRRATRFGFRHWQHPTLASELFDDTPYAKMLSLIDECDLKHEINGDRKLWELDGPEHNLAGRHNRDRTVWEPLKNVWRGSAVDLEKWLTGEMPGWKSTVAKEAEKLFRHVAIDRLLGRLKEDAIDRVAQHRTGKRRMWAIAAPDVDDVTPSN